MNYRSKTILDLALFLLVVVGLAACSANATAEGKVVENPLSDLPPFYGEPLPVAVSKFNTGGNVAAEWSYTDQYGTTVRGSMQGNANMNLLLGDLTAMLEDLLVASERFRVLERQDFDQTIRAEEGLRDEEWLEADADSARGQVAQADVLITGSMTEYQPNARESGVGGGGIVAVVGGFLGKNKDEARVKFVLKAIDRRTSEVVATVQVEGTGTGESWLGGAGAFLGAVIGGGYMTEKEAAPINEAAYEALAKGVKDLIQKLERRGYIRSGAPPAYAPAPAGGASNEPAMQSSSQEQGGPAAAAEM